MPGRSSRLALLAALLCAGAAAQRASAEPTDGQRFSLDDLARLIHLGTPALSADGAQAALIVSHRNPDADEVNDMLVLVDTNSGAQRELAYGTLKSPQFSPRGDQIAFLQADGDKTLQIMSVALAPGAASPRAVTTLPHGAGVKSFAWSPDGHSFAYLARAAVVPATGDARFDVSFEVADPDYLGTSYLDRNAGPPPTLLWLIDAGGGQGQLLPTRAGTIEAMAWRPDGQALVINAHPGTSIVAERYGTLTSIEVSGGRETTLVNAPANFSVEAPMRIASSGAVAYHSYRGPDPWLSNHNVTVVALAAHPELTRDLDMDIMAFDWQPDGKALLVSGYEHVRNTLWRVPLRGAARRVDVGNVEFEDFAVAAGSGAIAFIGSETTAPPELYVLRSLRAKLLRLTHFHDALSAKTFGRVDALNWSGDGLSHTGVVTYPPDFAAGRSYPLLVNIHGGPHTSANLAFNGDAQAFAAAGWIVFEPNYRGSSGEGEKYRMAVVGDATEGPGRDIRSGVEALKARGSVDPRRIAVTGYSYGGVMSSWMIGHYHDWCAAMPGGVVVDFADYYDQSNTGIWIKSLLGSPHLKQNHDKYVTQSPVSYLDQVNTPTLIQQNVGDPNAGVTQAYTLYHAIKDHGTKSRLVLFGVDGHGLDDPFLERRSNALKLAWMEENCPAAR